MDLEQLLNDWMSEHEAELLDLMDEELDRFLEHHPGLDPKLGEQQALFMANRRYLARAIGSVLPAWLQRRAPADEQRVQPGTGGCQPT